MTLSILGHVAPNPPFTLNDTFDSDPLELVSKGQVKLTEPILLIPYCLVAGTWKLIDSAVAATVFVASIKNTYLYKF